MRPYSEDIRTRVIRAYQNREGSQRQIASRFNVSLGFVRTLLKRYRDTGNFSPKAHVGPASKIDRKSLQLILHMVASGDERCRGKTSGNNQPGAIRHGHHVRSSPVEVSTSG